MTDTLESIKSKKQIIKSTGIIGSSQIFTIALQIVRTKIIALLLGPAGVGLLGIYNTIVDMVRSVTGMGINFSGVREIAQACAANNHTAIAQKALILRRWAYITGFIGVVVLLLLCYPISLFSFNSADYTYGIAFLGIAVFFTSVSQSQIALLQGSRNLLSMAKASVIGVMLSIMIVTPIYYFWGQDGMVVAILLMSISSYVLSHYYVSKLNIQKTEMSWKDTIVSGKEMVKLGFANAISGIIGIIAMYYIRAFISSHGSIEEVGFFQASWSISNVYLLAVLNAMAADFFPRLSAVNCDNEKVNKLVNDQTEIALLIGVPIIICMFVFSSLIITVLYSSDFELSATLLDYFVIGSFFKILSWPICYISAAKGAIKQILVSEISWNILFVIGALILWDKMGLKGIGISYIISYVYYLVLLFFLVNPLSRFRWERTNIIHIVIFGVVILLMFIMTLLEGHNLLIGLCYIIPITIYSYVRFNAIVNVRRIIIKAVRKLI